jgi:tRNA-modifying protein YgfZ
LNPIDLTPRFGCLRMTGASRLDFIQRMSTGDVRTLTPGRAGATFFTTPNGRIVDLSWVLCRENDVLLLTGGGNQDKLLRWLRKYIFFNDDVQLGAFGQGVRVIGWPGDPHGAPGTVVEGDDRLSFIPPAQYGLAQIDISLTGDTPAGLESAAAYEGIRLRLGLPLFPEEIGEEYIPLETGVWSAVSFSKGCYIGQEIIARMESRNQIARHLVTLQVDGVVQPGTALRLDGATVGTLTSVHTTCGLGYVRSTHSSVGAVIDAGEARVVILATVRV